MADVETTERRPDNERAEGERPKAPAVRRGPNRVDEYLRYYYSLRATRAYYDRRWQLCSDYILARRDFTVATRPDMLRPHRITSQVATQANARAAAFVLAT